MADLAEQLTGFLNSEEGQRQLNQVLSMLSSPSQGDSPAQEAPPPAEAPAPQQMPERDGQATSPGIPDFSALLSALGGGASPTAAQAPSPETGALLTSLLQGLTASSAGAGGGPAQGTPGLGSLLSALSGGSPPGGEQAASNPLGNIDFNMILKIQQAFSAMSQNDKNTALLLALKPHLSEERQRKVDQAVLMMKILRILPMIADSGILGNLKGLLPSLGTT